MKNFRLIALALVLALAIIFASVYYFIVKSPNKAEVAKPYSSTGSFEGVKQVWNAKFEGLTQTGGNSSASAPADFQP